jgi:hypothetical protein
LDETDFVITLDVLKKQSKDNCLIAMLEEAANATTTPNTEGATPSQSHTVTISSNQSTAPGIASTLNSNPPQPTPKGHHSSTKAAISLCLHPNNKSIVFSRQPKPNKFEDNVLIKMLQQKLCKRITACDSIRTLADGQAIGAFIYNKPPKFIQHPQGEEKTDSIGAVETPIPKKLLFSPEPRTGASISSGVPTVSIRDRPDNVKVAVSKLKTAIEYCFIKPQAVFVT